ncbi:hypothetical protein [Sphingobium sp.]|uniref:hypothetical protein n=1 Tax=Sphingobium sp. TaxID=1912891 RepID=UPI002B5ACB37|nr:hypothetical protein [Sphingobium sp.]HUD91751.1 hypothetical protein [Sphingobium sp.]
MTTNPSHCAFKVRIDYFSGAEAFATQTVRLDVHNSSEAHAAASRAAEACTYHNERVPELSYTVTIVPLDPDDPEPSSAGARVKPVCADCGSDQLVRDAAVRWDMDAQDWTISGIFECTTCDLCGAESDDLATWVDERHVTPLGQYICDLAEALGKVDAEQDYRFPIFSLDHYQQTPVAEAVVAWRAIERPAP